MTTKKKLAITNLADCQSSKIHISKTRNDRNDVDHTHDFIANVTLAPL